MDDGAASSKDAVGARIRAAAERALAEAAERRADRARREHGKPQLPEVDGRKGPEPARYGDWEVKGIASDF